MNHEPECNLLLLDEWSRPKFPQLPSMCNCEQIRAAYRRGRVDALDWRKLGLPPAVISNADAWDGEQVIEDNRLMGIVIQRLRELHRLNQPAEDCDPECWACETPYPCATIRALDGEQA